MHARMRMLIRTTHQLPCSSSFLIASSDVSVIAGTGNCLSTGERLSSRVRLSLVKTQLDRMLDSMAEWIRSAEQPCSLCVFRESSPFPRQGRWRHFSTSPFFFLLDPNPFLFVCPSFSLAASCVSLLFAPSFTPCTACRLHACVVVVVVDDNHHHGHSGSNHMEDHMWVGERAREKEEKRTTNS